jgi:hypothetical protein
VGNRYAFVIAAAFVLVGLSGCEDDKKERLLKQTAGEAGGPMVFPDASTVTASPPPSAPATPSASTSADAKRFDPKHKCPTGQTHFYLEGDFCRRKCFTNADCGKGERCSVIDYPFVVDGGTAGMAKFCEGT